MAVDVPCSCLSGDVSAMLRQAGRAAEGLREHQAKAMPDLLSVLMVVTKASFCSPPYNRGVHPGESPALVLPDRRQQWRDVVSYM
jgi:hypothetical protein